MKVLHINCNYMGTALHQIMIEHLNPFIESAVFCPIYTRSHIETKPKDYVTTSECFKKIDRFFFFRKQKKIIKAVEQAYLINNFDLIHAYTLFTDGNTAYELSKKYNIPYIVAIRATDFDFFKYRVNLRKRGLLILKNASKIIFLSEKSKERFMNNYIPSRLFSCINIKSLVIPNGIDDFWLNNIYMGKRILNKSDTELICVSQIIKRKNIPLIQRAVREVSNMHLTVIGRGVDKRLLKKIKADKNTTYIEPINKEELLTYYRKSDIFILPSVGETFGLVYAEALSQGLPIIYTENEGFDGQVKENIGVSVKPQVESIKNALGRVSREYEAMSINTAKVVHLFSWDRITKIYEQVYLNVGK